MKRFALSLMLFFVASLCGLAVYSQCTTPSHGNSFYYLTGVNTAGGSRNIAVSNSGYNSANAGYTDDFLNHEVAINPGNKFNLSLSTNNALTYKRVWVDWNRDGEFNGTDELVSIFGNSTGTTVSDSIEVSASRAGTYRMRIQTRYYASFPQPCGYYASGETEDYALVASVANDAALLALEKDLYCFGSQDIKVRLKNNGNNNLTSVSIAGRLGNTTFNTFNFSGSLAPGSDTLISLGNHSFTAGQADTLRIYSFSPNATSDGNSIDDTLSKIIRPAMSGTYTIGGTNPDYNGFTAAFNALNNNGLCGNVVFEVRSGTYTESFFIDAYDGSENYSITVRQAASNSSDPLVQNSAQVVKLRSALNLIWDGVNIKNTGFSNAIYFQGNNRDITFKNATIEGTSSNSTTVSYATIYDLSGATNQSENIRIESNTIKGGSYGLFVNGGSTSTPDKDWLIKNNTVEDFYYMGIRADYTDSLVLEGNSVQDKGVYSYPYGIYANFSMNIKLRSNDIQFDNKIGPYGIFMSRCDGTGGDSVEVINNFIRIEGSSTSYGLYLSQVDYANVDFNTVRLSSNNQASYALYSNFSLHGRYRNNNLAQFGSGAVVYLNPTTSLYVNQCDYNNYYSSGNGFGFAGGNRSDLNAWKAVVSFDQNTLSVDPEFRNLNAPTPNNPALDSAGISLAHVNVDIQGTSRGNFPDIGCEEFTPSTNDLSILEVFDASICPGTTDVQVRVRNAGINPITSLVLDWSIRVNNATPTQQQAQAYNLNLAPRKDTVLSLGSFNFITTNHYVLRAWVDSVNQVVDQFTGGNTASSDSLRPGMNGTYTIGGASPDFTTVNAALSELNTRGVCGPVVFNVRAGTYTGAYTFVQVRGASATNTITFQTDPASSSQAIWQNSFYPIYINQGNHFVFKNLNIKVTGSNRVVYVVGPSEGIRFEDNLLEGSLVSSSSTSFSVVDINAGTNTPVDDYVFKGNTFKNGSYGIYGRGQSGRLSRGMRIEDNVFEDYYYSAVYLNYYERTLIEGNEMIDRGVITTPYHLGLSYCHFSKVDANHVKASNGYGIFINRCDGASGDSVIVSNNFISYTGTPSTNSYGLYLNFGSYQAVHHNSVYYRGVNLTSSYAAFITYGSARSVKNNIFMNTSGGQAIYIWPNASVSSIDHNNYFVSGNNLGYYGATRGNLSQWQTATGQDANSLSVDPQFVSFTDLHIQNNALNNAGTPVSTVPEDFDGDLRSTSTPDIGADELTLFQTDAQIRRVEQTSICPGSSAVEVVLRNAGLDTLTSVSINWAIATNSGSFQAQSAVSYNGFLLNGQETTLNLGSFNFVDTNRYNIRAWVSTPNGLADSNATNDTAYTGLLRPAMSGVYTVGGSAPDYPTLTDALNALDSLGVCSDVVFYVRPGTYNGRITLKDFQGRAANRRLKILGDTLSAQMPEFRHNNWTFQLDNASWYDIENIKIVTTGFNPTIYIASGKNHNIRFLSDSLQTVNTSSNSVYYSVVYKNNNTDMEAFEFRDNVLLYGHTSVYLFRSTNEEVKDILFENNTLLEYSTYGFYCDNLDSISIRGNYLKSVNTRYAYPMYFNQSRYLKLTGNEVNQPFGGNGISLYSCTADATNPNLIANNMIYNAGSGGGYGIYQSNCVDLDILHNSVNFYQGPLNSYPLYSSSGTNIRNEMNNYVSTLGGYAMYWYSFNNSVSDYNNLYTTGSTNYLRYGGTNYTSLAAYRSASNQEANSLSADPNFFANDDLHCNSVFLDSVNNYVGISLDFDGETRNTTHPDIGADEFIAVDEDAAIQELVSAVCPGTNDIEIRVKNFGAQVLTSAKIQWSVAVGQGGPVVQTPFSFNAGMVTGSDTLVRIGSFNFAAGFSYNFRFWVDSVNGLQDGNQLNDTLKVNNLRSSFSGTYTVGGSNPNYANIGQILSDMRALGLCGPTTVLIRPGSYAEQLNISGINGLSAQDSLVFMRDTNFAGQAEIRASSAALLVRNAPHVHVEGLHFVSTGNGNTALLEGNINGLRLYNNAFEAINTNSNSTSLAVIRRSAGITNTSSNIVIEKNAIRKGSRGIEWSNSGDHKLRIIDNDIRDFAYYGIYVNSTDTLEVEYNLLRDSSQYMGIYLNYVNTYQVSNNEIDLVGNYSNGYGIYCNYSDGTVGNLARIYNNAIRLSPAVSNNARAVIWMNYCDHVGLYFNSLNFVGTNSSASALYLNFGSNLDIRNNNLVNSGGGYAYYRNSASQVNVSDYNNLYTTGSTLAYYNGNRSNIAAWRTATGRDANSIAVDPIYSADNDLHAYAVDLDSAATPISGITKDFDGENRNTSHPDIGMDEFTPFPLNIGLIDLETNNCPGNRNISLRFKNLGSNTISYARFQWAVRVNGASPQMQNAYSYSGSLNAGVETSVNLGSFTYNDKDYYEWIVYVDSLNAGADQDNSNDTIQTNASYTALSGNYYIGGNNPDFLSILDADTNLDNRGICGPVSFFVRPGTYNEQSTWGDFNGASAVNTVRLSSDSGFSSVQWSHSGTPLRIRNASFFTVDDLSIASTGNSVIEFEGTNDHVKIENNHLEGVPSASSSSSLAVILEPSNNNYSVSHSEISGNTITFGSAGIQLLGSSSIIEVGNRVENNRISDFGNLGVNLQYQDSIVIAGNVIDNGNGVGDQGVLLSQINYLEFLSNKLVLDRGAAKALNLSGLDASNNKRNLIANNMLSVSIQSGSGYGMNAANNRYTDFFHNSVLVQGTSNNSSAMQVLGGSLIRVQNNSLVNEAGGYAYNINSPTALSLSDYNNLYSSASNLVFRGTNYTNLSSWQTASGFDLNGVSADPFYLAFDDLHSLSADLDAAGLGGLLAQDFDGDTRNASTPDIGADEFTLLNNDAGLTSMDEAFFCNGTQAILVDLRNFGANALSSVRINWSVSKNSQSPQLQTPYNWSGSLTTGAVAGAIQIGTYNFHADTLYELSVWVDNPNGTNDPNALNDTLVSAKRRTALSGTYSVGGFGADYLNLTAACNDLNSLGVCGPVRFKIRGATYNEGIFLTHVEGVSATNTIDFEPDSINTGPVKLMMSTRVLDLVATNYVRVRGLELEVSSGAAIRLASGSSHAIIEDNLIKHSIVSAWSSQHSAIHLDGNALFSLDSNRFINNRVEGGYHAVYSNAVNQRNSGNSFESNTFANYINYAFDMRGEDALSLIANSIIDSSDNRGSGGINIVFSDAVQVVGNRIYNRTHGNAYALVLNNVGGSSQMRNRIVNNEVSAVAASNTPSSRANGISLIQSNFVDVYFNTVHTADLNPATRALNLNSSNQVRSYNNIFSSETGYAVYVVGSPMSASNYNAYYSGGNFLAYQGNHRADLNAWRNVSGSDQQSVQTNPNFISPSYLYPNNIALDSSGLAIAGITQDIDGQNRPNVPDMGAYQFVTRRNDAGVFALTSNKACSGNSGIFFDLKNYGGDTLRSVRIHWFVSTNGAAPVAQTPYNWTGSLSIGETAQNINVGSLNLNGGDTYFISAFTVSPNGQNDELRTNDTLASTRLFVRLSGSYTLGDTASDFVNLAALQSAFNNAGVCGPVSIRVKSGTHYGSLRLDAIEGHSASNSIRLTADTGSIPHIWDSLPVVSIRDMESLRIDHLHLEGTGSHPVIELYGHNKNIQIDSNRIQAAASYSNIKSEAAIYEANAIADRLQKIRIESNRIEGGAYGVSLSGSNQYYPDNGIEVLNNEIMDFRSAGVDLQYLDSVHIEANRISAAYDALSPEGVNLNHLSRLSFLRNKLVMKALGGTALKMNQSSGTQNNPLEVYNNFIQAGGNALGVDFSHVDNVNFYFNSLNIVKDSLGNSGKNFRAWNTTNLDLKNNNLVNASGGFVFAGNSYPFSSDFNNLYTTGTHLANQISDLSTWVSVTSKDGNSLSADPVYLSEEDLHANQSLLDSAALALNFITVDIDGDARNFNFPDIGADEFTLINNVGVVKLLEPLRTTGRRFTQTAFDTAQILRVVIKNFGPAISNVPVFFEFNGQQGTDTIRVSLAQAAEDTLSFTTRLNLDTLGEHELKVFTGLSNDQFTENDTLTVSMRLLDNKPVLLPVFEGFEQMPDTFNTANAMGLRGAEAFDFETQRGRLQSNSGFRVDGNRAISLDRPRLGPQGTNYLIYTLNLSNYDIQDSIYLTFDYMDHGEERDREDRVWIRGNDSAAWIDIYDLWGNRRRGGTKSVSRIAITTELAKAGQSFGSSFQIRFGEKDNEPIPRDGFSFDNILLDIVHPIDLVLSGVQSDYYKIPLEHDVNLFSANLFNKGYNRAVSVRFKYQTLNMTDSVMVDSLAAKANTRLAIVAKHSAQNFGDARVRFEALSSAMDGDRRNDTSSIVLEITDTILARDNGSVDSSFGFIGTGGEMAQLFSIPKADTITGISFFLNKPNVGDSVRVKVYAENNGVPGTELLRSETFGFQSNAGRWYYLQFNCLQMLDSGNFFVAVEQMNARDLSLGFSYFNYREDVAVYKTTQSNWTSLSAVGIEAIFSLRPIFGHYPLPSLNVRNAICENEGPTVFRANPSGGRFIGTGMINDSIFDPAVSGRGSFQIKYYVTQPNACIDTNGFVISVDSLSNLTFVNPADMCSNAASLVLQTAQPTGGVYSGPGVSANTFDPAQTGAGSFQLYYEYTNAFSCLSRDSAQITVLQAPVAQLSSLASFCENDTARILTEGSPVGGIYLGQGVLGNSFNPQGLAPGVYEISYVVTDPNTCSDTARRDVVIDTLPQVDLGPDISLCGNQSDTLMVMNSPADYVWSTGELTQSIVVKSGGLVYVLVTDQNGCSGSDSLDVSYEAICVGMDEDMSGMRLSYYPNPNNGRFKLQVEGLPGRLVLRIRDAQARLIASYKWEHSKSNWTESIDISNQAAGVYLLEFETERGRRLHRISVR